MNALSLFSGIGGLDIAAEWAGFKTVAFCERDRFCKSVLAARWPNVRIYDDVRTIDTSELPAVELVHGGYPCQPFSQAGRRAGHADERHLWPAMLRVVQDLRPAWVVGENVTGHIAIGLDSVCDDLEAAGYAVRPVVLPACAAGAPHTRERVFVLAHAKGDRLERPARENREPTGGERSKGGMDAFRSGARVRRDGCGWGAQPGMGRVVDGLSARMDRRERLKALGNAVVPLQAYPIFAAIAETYNYRISEPCKVGDQENGIQSK